MKGKREDHFVHAKIQELFRNGEKIEKIAEDFKLHRSTVYRIVNERSVNPKKWGRPTKLSMHDRRHLINEFRKNKHGTASKLAKSVQFPVSDRTIQRELHHNEFRHKKV